MELLVSVLQKFSCLWCWERTRPADGYNLDPFLQKQLPIFWIMGPSYCGKTTLAEMLAKASKYHLLKVNQLVEDEIKKGKWRSKIILDYLNRNSVISEDIIINLLKEAFIRTHENCIGYIIDGFPLHVREAKLFEHEICKVSMVIYVTLDLDAFLARIAKNRRSANEEMARLKYINRTKELNIVYKKYESKTIKLYSNYPPEDMCNQLIEDLEDFWAYQF